MGKEVSEHKCGKENILTMEKISKESLGTLNTSKPDVRIYYHYGKKKVFKVDVSK